MNVLYLHTMLTKVTEFSVDKTKFVCLVFEVVDHFLFKLFKARMSSSRVPKGGLKKQKKIQNESTF